MKRSQNVKNLISTNKGKTIICKDCGKPFDFSEGEEKYFKSNDLATPICCKSCRVEHKKNYGLDSITAKLGLSNQGSDFGLYGFCVISGGFR